MSSLLEGTPCSEKMIRTFFVASIFLFIGISVGLFLQVPTNTHKLGTPGHFAGAQQFMAQQFDRVMGDAKPLANAIVDGAVQVGDILRLSGTVFMRTLQATMDGASRTLSQAMGAGTPASA